MSAALLLLGLALAATPEEGLRAGSDAYTAGDYPAAIEAWRGLIEDGHVTGDVYYNLGSAWYRAGDLGKAVLCWRRAALLSPRDGDIEANLERARREATDRLDAPSRVTPFFWTEMLSLSEQGHAASWLLALLLSLGLAQRLRPELPLGIPGALVGVPAVLLAAGVVYSTRELNRTPAAVVLSPVAEVRSATGEAGGVVLFELHPGAEVQVRERLGASYQITLPDERRGWISAQDLGLIDPRLPPP